MLKSIVKKTPQNKKWTDRTLRQMIKAKLYRHITQRSIHIHTHKKGKRKNNVYKKIKKIKEGNQINKQIYQ